MQRGKTGSLSESNWANILPASNDTGCAVLALAPADADEEEKGAAAEPAGAVDGVSWVGLG